MAQKPDLIFCWYANADEVLRIVVGICLSQGAPRPIKAMEVQVTPAEEKTCYSGS